MQLSMCCATAAFDMLCEWRWHDALRIQTSICCATAAFDVLCECRYRYVMRVEVQSCSENTGLDTHCECRSRYVLWVQAWILIEKQVFLSRANGGVNMYCEWSWHYALRILVLICIAKKGLYVHRDCRSRLAMPVSIRTANPDNDVLCWYKLIRNASTGLDMHWEYRSRFTHLFLTRALVCWLCCRRFQKESFESDDLASHFCYRELFGEILVSSFWTIKCQRSFQN